MTIYFLGFLIAAVAYYAGYQHARAKSIFESKTRVLELEVKLNKISKEALNIRNWVSGDSMLVSASKVRKIWSILAGDE